MNSEAFSLKKLDLKGTKCKIDYIFNLSDDNEHEGRKVFNMNETPRQLIVSINRLKMLVANIAGIVHCGTLEVLGYRSGNNILAKDVDSIYFHASNPNFDDLEKIKFDIYSRLQIETIDVNYEKSYSKFSLKYQTTEMMSIKTSAIKFDGKDKSYVYIDELIAVIDEIEKHGLRLVKKIIKKESQGINELQFVASHATDHTP